MSEARSESTLPCGDNRYEAATTVIDSIHSVRSNRVRSPKALNIMPRGLLFPFICLSLQ